LIKRLFIKSKGICYLCGQLMNSKRDVLEPDHYIPVCHKGSNNEDNLRLTHRRCNRRKSGKHPRELPQVGNATN
jgi:5-methylcytosine-specific restriction endonuclease McrA